MKCAWLSYKEMENQFLYSWYLSRPSTVVLLLKAIDFKLQILTYQLPLICCLEMNYILKS